MKPRQRIAAVSLFGLAVCLGSASSFGSVQEIEAVDSNFFQSIDLNDDGKLSRREILHFGDLLFLSADADGDERLTLEEFLLWDPGYLSIAEATGRTSQLNAAKREVFESRDLNGDGRLDYDEFSATFLYDFYRADVNGDRMLSQDEFIGEFGMVKTIRSALN